MKKNLSLITVVLTLALMIACSDSDDSPSDKKDPVIELTKPQANEVYGKLKNIEISGTFSDDRELKDIVFTLTFPEVKSAQVIEPDAWAPKAVTIPLEGKSQTFTDEKIFEAIPNDIKSGNYNLNIKLSDATGKTSEKTITIKIE
jgi:hypothetical protein